jgi:hypothetical protein
LDKRPVYPGAIPLDIDTLQPQRNIEIALGYLMQAAFGTSTVIDGLAVTQQATPNMTVQVGPGSIIFNTTVDTLTSGFGSLPVDNSDPLVKIGINSVSTNMSALTAPGTAGQSQNWLVEAQFLEADGAPVVLPFYNAANPATPYTGPANSGAPSNTARTNRVQLQWKGGTAATTGTQNTPTPDAGWTGVAIVTVANGQASITNANITPYSLAPYVPTKLSVQRTRCMANLNLYVATTGSDTANSGLSAASPFLTLQQAWNTIVNNYDMSGYTATINVANGTYSSGVFCSGTVQGGGSIAFVGNVATPANVTITTSNAHCFAVYSPGITVNISGFTLTTSGTVSGVPAIGILSNTGCTVQVAGNMTFGTVAGQHLFANTGGGIILGSSYSITGGGLNHILGALGGNFNTGSGPYTVTLTGTPAFSNAFISLTELASAQVLNSVVTWSGAATGTRYSATLNAIIATGGGGASYFPGNAAGSTGTGGQYA